MLELYETTDCVLHGIGDAQTMATMRNTPDRRAGYDFKTMELKAKHSVIILTRMATLSTDYGQSVSRLAILRRIPLIISVAGGSSKAEAILAYMASAPKQTILVTDEGAANEMLKILDQ